ncbi:hypothetical protein OG301_02665 [Streptomyces platensis]|uniref:hypothetical protein n=1 Tax=Streptomyces platensis TaxID=58346 RepID=UPI002ED515C3|nr:hypothetical protein OG301_02665 [Streptomyces platensis]
MDARGHYHSVPNGAVRRQAAERAVGARILMNDDGTVASFIAGERHFADLLPCGSD